MTDTAPTDTIDVEEAVLPAKPESHLREHEFWWWALAVFAFALVVRLVYMAQVRHCPLFMWPTIDAATYYGLAKEFYRNNWLFPQGEAYWQPPFYSAVIGLLMNVVGKELLAVKTAQFTIGSANCALIYILGRRIFSRKVGVIAGFAAALYGPMIYFDGELLTPTVQTCLNLCCVLLLLNAVEKRSIKLAAASGFLLGLSIITRPDVAGFLIVAVVWICFVLRREITRLRLVAFCGLFIVCAVAPIVPVLLRNLYVGENRAVISVNGGINFYIGNNAREWQTQNTRPGTGWDVLVTKPKRLGGARTSSEMDAWFYHEAFAWIKSHPGAYLWLQVKKMGEYITAVEWRRNHDLYWYRNYSPLYSALIFRVGGFAFPFGLLFPLAVVGLLRAKRRPETWLLYGYLAAQMLATVAFFVCARYRMVNIPILLLFGAFGATEIYRIAKQRAWKSAALPLSIGLAALIFSNANVYGIDTDRKSMNAESHFYMAQCYAEQDQPKTAIAECRKALSLDPDHQYTYFFLGKALATIGKKKEAIKAAYRGLEIYPYSEEANNKCGEVLSDAGDLWGALKCYQKAKPESPWSVMPLFDLMKKATKVGDFPLCVAAMEAVAKQTPNMEESQRRAKQLRALLEKEGGHMPKRLPKVSLPR